MANQCLEKLPPSEVEINRLQVQIKQLENLASEFSEELQFSQNYDRLTNLPNQALFYDRIVQAITRGHRYDYLAAVVIIDISLFNQINYSIGRTGGDFLLKQLADRLLSVLRQSDGVALLNQWSDELTISRFGDDEFGVLLMDLKSKESITWIIKRILDIFSIPFEVENHKIYVNCNLGVSLYPIDADTPEKANKAFFSCKTIRKTNAGDQ